MLVILLMMILSGMMLLKMGYNYHIRDIIVYIKGYYIIIIVMKLNNF